MITSEFNFNEISNINVIANYPKELAEEMFVLLRRISYLKLMIQNTPEFQYESLNDVKNFDDFITNLAYSKRLDIVDLAKRINPSYFYRLENEQYESDN